MTSSNLPPGCSSPDGGIDHKYEGALDHLCDVAQTPEDLNLLRRLAEVVLPWLREAYADGLRDGRGEAEERESAAQAVLATIRCEFPAGSWQRRDIDAAIGREK